MSKKGASMGLRRLGKYTTSELIGSGTFGRIYKAQRNGDKELVAIKVIDLTKCNAKDREHAENEKDYMQELCHPNLVKYVDSFYKERDCICIVMELCERGTLREYIQQQVTGLEENEFISITKQICKGLKYMHDRNLVHRDVKTSNIFLTSKDGPLCVKIGDFGLVKKLDEENVDERTQYVGTPFYMSPEMCSGHIYDKTTDIWGLGSCCYEMATKKHGVVPKACQSEKDIIEFLKKYEDEFSLADCSYSNWSKHIIATMLQKTQTVRPTVDDVIAALSRPNVTSQTRQGRYKDGPKHKPVHKSRSFNTVDDISFSNVNLEGSSTDDKSGYMEVEMTDDEVRCYTKTKRIINELHEEFNIDAPTITQITERAKKTKRQDTFMREMKQFLATEIFDVIEGDLNALWGYSRKLPAHVILDEFYGKSPRPQYPTYDQGNGQQGARPKFYIPNLKQNIKEQDFKSSPTEILTSTCPPMPRRSLMMDSSLTSGYDTSEEGSVLGGLASGRTENIKLREKVLRPKRLTVPIEGYFVITPPGVWPIYDFGCNHVDSIVTQYNTILRKCSLPETNTKRQCKERLHRDIRLMVAGNAEQFMKKEFQHASGKESNKDTKKVGAVVVSDEIGRNHPQPTVLVVLKSDIPTLSQLIRKESLASYLGLIVDDNPQEQDIDLFSECSLVSESTKENIEVNIDCLLERFVLNIVYKITENLRYVQHTLGAGVSSDTTEVDETVLISDVTTSTNPFNLLSEKGALTFDNSRQIEENTHLFTEVLSEIKDMYSQSDVPESDKPSFHFTPTQPVHKTIVQKILGIENVVGCGDRYGTLYVHIDKNILINTRRNQTTIEHVEKVLQENGIKTYCFQHVSRDIKPLKLCGTKIGPNKGGGTLGGFAWQEPLQENKYNSSKHLCALVSGHVSKCLGYGPLTIQDNVFGHFLDPFFQDGRDLDIAAAKVIAKEVPYCNIMFKDDRGYAKQNRLLVIDKHTTTILPKAVHIWGASSAPGLGTILIPNYGSSPSFDEELPTPLMVLIDRSENNNEPFCKPGDSGAIVCANERRGRFVYVIAMIVGEFQNTDHQRQYLAVQLNAGLEQLGQRHNCQFKLCD